MAYHSTCQKGFYNHPLYQTWQRMLRRCYDSSCSDYGRYGARRIAVCSRWWSIENFISDMGIKPIGTTLGRVNNNGDYSPANCRWETNEQQNRNRRSTKLSLMDVAHIKELRRDGQSYRAIARLYKVDHSTIYHIFKEARHG